MDKFDIEAELDRLRQEMNLPKPKKSPKFNSNSRLLSKNLFSILTLLVLSLTASICWFRESQKQELTDAHKLREELQQASQRSSSLNIDFFQMKKTKIKKAVDSLGKIPDVPGFLYSQSQDELQKLRQELQDTQQNLNAGQKLEGAKKLAMEAATQSQNSALPLEDWQKVQAKWQQAIEALDSIPANTFFFAQARAKLPVYKYNYLIISKKVAQARTAMSLRQKGSNIMDRGDYEKAILYLTQAININPSQAEPYIDRGTAYFSLGRKREAKVDFQKAINLSSQQKNKENRQIAQDLLNLDKDMYLADYAYNCNLDTSNSSSFTWLRCNINANVRNKSSKNYYNVNLVFIISDETGNQIGLINKLLFDFKANSSQSFTAQESIILSEEEAIKLKENVTTKVLFNAIETDVPYCTTELLNSDVKRCYNNNGNPSETYYKDIPIDSNSSSFGKCDHSDQVDSRGRRCGGRSAGSRLGGR